MSPELEKRLCAAYPVLYIDRYADMRSTCMCWGFDCGDGWYDIIDALSKKIAKHNSEHPKSPCIASQVKEKYGTLRFYVNGGTEEIYKWIHKAEKASAKTCEVCGKPGKLRGVGWYYTACRKCEQARQKERERCLTSRKSSESV